MLSAQVSPTELIEAARELPGAPRLLIELGMLIHDPGTDARDVTDLLKQDPALAARLIRMANSAVYARSEPVSSTEGAVSCIGFEEVHRLVGALAATQLAEQRLDLHGIDGARLRKISLFTAVLMEELATPAGESRRRCYTVGLLRSVGMMALEIIGRRHGRVPPFNPGSGQPVHEWEKCHWGIDNCEAAEIILKDWRLPHETVIAIRHHYLPDGYHNPIIHLLALAAGSAADRYQGIAGEENYWRSTPENFRKAGLPMRDFQLASEKAQQTFQRLEAALA
ncbi:HDOD domain protein [Lacunisphaera limnophila]|uniref:HDOD domain protein n=1 Tax=Lacunisphaera limnophila TaxID=1838286 RepID=A0A1I7PHR7_9BACT|nr:HDOD domain-containing protein [Lacunisphaera limnophila]AOS43159.1 HDOD domain protein [Lacunisphaera limnophila]